MGMRSERCEDSDTMDARRLFRPSRSRTSSDEDWFEYMEGARGEGLAVCERLALSDLGIEEDRVCDLAGFR